MHRYSVGTLSYPTSTIVFISAKTPMMGCLFSTFQKHNIYPPNHDPKNAQPTQTITPLPKHCMGWMEFPPPTPNRQRSCSHHLARRGSCYRRVTGSGTARFRSGRILSGNVAWTSRLGWRFLEKQSRLGCLSLGWLGNKNIKYIRCLGFNDRYK